MKTKTVLIFLCIFFLIHPQNIAFTFALPKSPANADRKIVIFKSKAQTQQFRIMVEQIHEASLDQLQIKTFDRLNSVALPMSSEIQELLYRHFDHVQIMDDIQVRAYPIQDVSYNPPLSQQNWNLELTGAPQLWEKGIKGKGVKIFILDTGIDASHEAFKDRVVNYAEFSQYGGIYRDDPKNATDSDSHGTHVAGIAAGATPDKAIGMAPEALLGAGIVIPRGSGTLSQIMAGLEWSLDPDGNPATNDQPHIINLSLGIPGYIKVWSGIFNQLLANNIFPVAAIGNDGDGICGSPGSTPNVFSVGAFDMHKNPAWFSCGADDLIWEDEFLNRKMFTKPEVSAPGVDIYSTIPGNRYASMSGTSMASPHVAGAAALLMQAFPTANALDIWHFLILGSEDQGITGPDSRFGQGSINLVKSYQLMESSSLVHGKVKGDFQHCNIINRSTNLPLYINPQGEYSSFLLAGSYTFDVYFRNHLIRSMTVDLQNSEKVVDFILPQSDEFLFQGVVKNDSAQALPSILRSGNQEWKTDQEGRFQLWTNAYEPVTVRSPGYVEQTILPGASTGYINIRLKKADLLLIEGYSNYLTSVNPPRIPKRYLLESFDQLQLNTAYINAEIESFSFDDIQDYPLIYYYCESGGLSLSEQEIFKKYLDQGGRMIFSGRMLLSLESFQRQTFLSSLFKASTREFLVFPSVKGSEDLLDTASLKFSLSGDLGANNQETCDVISTTGDADFIEPFLKYSETSGRRYAGMRRADGFSKAILLSFGLEGIGSPSDRIVLLQNLLSWMQNSSSFHIDLPTDTSYYLTITDEENKSKEIEINNGKVRLNNLIPKNYTFHLEGFGIKSQRMMIDFSSYQYYYMKIIPEPAIKHTINFIFKEAKNQEALYQVWYKSKLLLSDTIQLQKTLLLKLPPGQYQLYVTAKNMIPIQSDFVVKDTDLVFEEEVKENLKKVLIIDDSKLGVYFRDNNKIQEEYTKQLQSRKIFFELRSVLTEGFPSYIELIPYELIIYISGYNPWAMGDEKIFDSLSQYLDHHGSILFFGNGAMQILRDKPFLKDYAGAVISTSNTRERTIYASPNPWFSDIQLDIYVAYNEGLPRFPAFELQSDSTQALFRYINSNKVNSLVFKNKSHTCVVFPFGLENIILPAIKDELMKGVLKIFER
jgi:subtilisin family serine protease